MITSILPGYIVLINGEEGVSGLKAGNLHKEERKRQRARYKNGEMITAILPGNIVPINGEEGVSGLEAGNLHREKTKSEI